MRKDEKDILTEKVKELIRKKYEGAYWDYKEKWHSNKIRLLHDILCMSNNLVAEDAYIIIGVQDNGDICGVDSTDCNRKKQADIIDWLSHIKFAGDRPDIRVFWDVACDKEKTVDVILIPQKNNGPYFLKEQSKEEKVVAFPVIYTREGDKNTSITETATFAQTETLWRKRFGLLYNVQEKAAQYIYDLDNWEFIDGNDGAVWYYKGDPAYIITSISKDEEEGIETIKNINSVFWYLCTFLNVSYRPEVCFDKVFLLYNGLRLFQGLLPILDEGRVKVLDSQGYFVEGTVQHGMYEFIFAYMCGSEYAEEAKEQFERVIPIYKSEEERKQFEKYAESKGWCRVSGFFGSHKGMFKRRIDNCKVETPQVVGGISEERNIEKLLLDQRKGALFNFYNEENFSQNEQDKISEKIKEGFVLVEMLKKWRKQTS